MSRHGRNVQAKARRNARLNKSLAKHLDPTGKIRKWHLTHQPILKKLALDRRRKNAEIEEPYRKAHR